MMYAVDNLGHSSLSILLLEKVCVLSSWFTFLKHVYLLMDTQTLARGWRELLIPGFPLHVERKSLMISPNQFCHIYYR